METGAGPDAAAEDRSDPAEMGAAQLRKKRGVCSLSGVEMARKNLAGA